jgi:hypothetical protein
MKMMQLKSKHFFQILEILKNAEAKFSQKTISIRII